MGVLAISIIYHIYPEAVARAGAQSAPSVFADLQKAPLLRDGGQERNNSASYGNKRIFRLKGKY
jgi:hypothetical protein